MITQCSIRHLYNAIPKSDILIDRAKRFERRRCGHHELEQPLSASDCLTSVVDPKSSGINKHKLVVASQDDEIRAKLRSIPGVPLIYVKKSVMILEPMAGATEDLRSREERAKFKAGISRKRGSATVLGKRERDEDGGNENGEESGARDGDDDAARKRKKKGPKGPNPLSMKKPKARPAAATAEASTTATTTEPETQQDADAEAPKKKRKRTHKSKATEGSDGAIANAVAAAIQAANANPDD